MIVFAHRGASGYMPENTLDSFCLARKIGCDAIETDIHLTSDNQLVIIHDDDLSRTTNATGFVRDCTLSDIKRLDAGYWFTSNKRKYPFRGKGIRIPTLEEALREFPEMLFNIEPKELQDGMDRLLIDTLDKADALDRVIIATSNNWKFLQRIKAMCPSMRVNAPRQMVIRFWCSTLFSLHRFFRWDFYALQVPFAYKRIPIVSRRFIRSAHQSGKQVHCWTINNESDMKKLMEMGVDGIMSDYPDRVLKLLGRS